MKTLVHVCYSFSHSKGECWQNVFPTCTTSTEIALVDGLVKYNPRKRLSATEVFNNGFSIELLID